MDSDYSSLSKWCANFLVRESIVRLESETRTEDAIREVVADLKAALEYIEQI